jgi:cytochrome b subunit of formate dehydrogenase
MFMKYLCWVSFVNRLKQRWNVEKAWMVWVILLVFALTGFTVMYLKKFFKPYMGDDWWVDVVYYVLILPVYNILLLTYDFSNALLIPSNDYPRSCPQGLIAC